MRRPTVRMIRHPPSAVPAVSATRRSTTYPRGRATSESISPAASSSAAITPTDFWASLAPWLKASARRHRPLRTATGRRQRRVARAGDGAQQRGCASAPAKRRAPGRPRGRSSVPNDADGPAAVDAAPVDRVRCRPRRARRPTSPPTSACPELDGRPSAPGDDVPGHRRGQAGADHRRRFGGRDGDDAADRVGDRGAEQQRAEQVEDRGEQDRLQRPRGARGDQRGDRVGGVVQPVRDGERERKDDRDDERGVHDRGVSRAGSRPQAGRHRG